MKKKMLTHECTRGLRRSAAREKSPMESEIHSRTKLDAAADWTMIFRGRIFYYYYIYYTSSLFWGGKCK